MLKFLKIFRILKFLEFLELVIEPLLINIMTGAGWLAEGLAGWCRA